MKRFRTQILFAFALVAVGTGCAPAQFSTVANEDSSLSPFETETDLKIVANRDTALQENFAQNRIALNFQVTNDSGLNVGNLIASDFLFYENGSPISNFTFDTKSTQIGQRADIVFVFDITASMQNTINSAKQKVANFVESLQQNNVRASLCLVTFRDETVDQCNSFQEDDLNTPENENLIDFQNRLAKLKAAGGDDYPENQLRALMDTAQKTPWHTNAQRVAILITDATFHYSPNYKGDAGSNAPTYDEAADTLLTHQTMVFTIAPKSEGYDRDFGSRPALSALNGGRSFLYGDLLNGKTSLETIFADIVDRIATTYSIEYVVEQNPGLVPDRPLSERKIETRFKSEQLSKNKIKVQGVFSSMPQGRPEYKKRFPLSQPGEINVDSLRVFINGQEIYVGFEMIDHTIQFSNPPPAGAKIEFVYEMKNLRDNIRIVPVIVRANSDLDQLEVWMNGQLAGKEYYSLSPDLEGRYILTPNENVFSEADPFRIMTRGGLKIRAKAPKLNSEKRDRKSRD